MTKRIRSGISPAARVQITAVCQGIGGMAVTIPNLVGPFRVAEQNAAEVASHSYAQWTSRIVALGGCHCPSPNNRVQSSVRISSEFLALPEGKFIRPCKNQGPWQVVSAERPAILRAKKWILDPGTVSHEYVIGTAINQFRDGISHAPDEP